MSVDVAAQSYPEPCDVPVGNYTTLPNGWNVSTNNPNGVVWNNQFLRVPAGATVYFDRNVTMVKCTIRMEQSSKIIVEGSTGFTPVLTTSQNTIFFGCTGMWSAIEFKTKAGYALTDTEFRNASDALLMRSGNLSSPIFNYPASGKKFGTIERCTFRNNRYGITARDVNTMYFLPTKFADNNFVSDGLNLLPPYTNSKASAGIQLIRCLTTLNGNGTTFKKTGSGIYCFQSGLTLQGGTFENLDGNGTAFNGGVGIFGVNSSIHVQDATFKDVSSMVRHDGSYSFTVQRCTLTEGRLYGIVSNNNQVYRPRVNITNNVMTFSQVPVSAIELDRSPGAYNMSSPNSSRNLIEKNVINVAGTNVINNNSILLDISSNIPGTDIFRVYDNRLLINAATNFNPDFACHGIYLSPQTSGRYRVVDNYLDYNAAAKPASPSPHLGIVFDHVTGPESDVSGNDIYSNLFTINQGENEERASWIKCGIHIDESPNIEMCGNIGDDTYRLYHLSGALDYCDIAYNTIQTHWYGLICRRQPGSMNTILGAQKWHRNTWGTAAQYTRYSAFHNDFQFGGINASATGFWVDPAYPSHVPPGQNLMPSKVAPSGWFTEQAPNPPDEVENTNCPSGAEPSFDYTGLRGWDRNIVAGTYPYLSSAQQWDAERKLNLKLIRYPEIMQGDSASSAWFNNQVNASARRFAQFEVAYGNAFALPAGQEALLNGALTHYTYLLQESVRLDSLQGTLTTEDTILAQQQMANMALLTVAQDSFLYLNQQAYQLALSKLDTAALLLATLPATSAWETNRKALFTFWLKKARGQELLESELTSIRNIANRCPQTEGIAVREISFYLPVPECYAYTNENYWEGCVDTVIQRQSVKNEVALHPEYSLYPNPANEELIVTMPSSLEGTWTMNDISGKLMQSGRVQPEQTNLVISVKTMPEGVYVLRIRHEDGSTAALKAIVQH